MTDRKILITGSTKGIGKGIAKKFQEKGWQVCITGRDESEVNELVAQFNVVKKNSAIGIASDLGRVKEMKRVKEYILNQWGRLDSIVFNVGSGRGSSGINSSFYENKNLLYKNFVIPALNFSLFIDLLKSNNTNSIIFIGSIAQEVNVGAPVSYSYSKRALNIFAKSKAYAQITNKISINVINPGHIYTEESKWKHKKVNSSIEYENFISSNIPIGRFGVTDDVSEIILNIFENNHDAFLTGANLTIDGGTSLIS